MEVEVPQIKNKIINIKAAKSAALAGLDMLVRMQVNDFMDGNCGRYPYLFNYHSNCVKSYSTNWTTGIAVDAMLLGYELTNEKKYIDSAKKAVRYLKSLQYFQPDCQRVYGAINEVIPQGDSAHPRDGLTAALALLNYSVLTNDSVCGNRAKIFADWFCKVALERGYPYWTIQFDEKSWLPEWYGSFHSGSAYFLCRCFEMFEEEKYLNAAEMILGHYNQYHLDSEGNITVIVSPETKESLDGKGDRKWTTDGWEMMHRYNDDFGTLANLLAWKITAKEEYCQAGSVFLEKMTRIQRFDGGFGPEEFSIPAAGGTVLIEMLEARKIGLDYIDDEVINRAVGYLLKLQCNDENCNASGGFWGFQEPEYEINGWINLRSTAYSIIALLKYAGVDCCIYSI